MYIHTYTNILYTHMHDSMLYVHTYLHILIYMLIKVTVIKLISFSTSKAYSAFFFTLRLQSYVCFTCFIILNSKTVLSVACQLEISVYGCSCSFSVLSHSWLWIRITNHLHSSYPSSHSFKIFHHSYYS